MQNGIPIEVTIRQWGRDSSKQLLWVVVSVVARKAADGPHTLSMVTFTAESMADFRGPLLDVAPLLPAFASKSNPYRRISSDSSVYRQV